MIMSNFLNKFLAVSSISILGACGGTATNPVASSCYISGSFHLVEGVAGTATDLDNAANVSCQQMVRLLVENCVPVSGISLSTTGGLLGTPTGNRDAAIARLCAESVLTTLPRTDVLRNYRIPVGCEVPSVPSDGGAACASVGRVSSAITVDGSLQSRLSAIAAENATLVAPLRFGYQTEGTEGQLVSQEFQLSDLLKQIQ